MTQWPLSLDAVIGVSTVCPSCAGKPHRTEYFEHPITKQPTPHNSTCPICRGDTRPTQRAILVRELLGLFLAEQKKAEDTRPAPSEDHS